MTNKNVIPLRAGRSCRPPADSEVTEIAIGDYVALRRVFVEGSSYLTILGPDGAILFVSKNVLDVCIPSLISAFEAGRERGLAQGFTRGRNDIRMQVTKLLAMENVK